VDNTQSRPSDETYWVAPAMHQPPQTKKKYSPKKHGKLVYEMSDSNNCGAGYIEKAKR